LGVNKDPKKAAEMMEKAAESGNVYAQYNLGIFYRDGNGVEQNDKASAQWFEKASDNGFQEAKADLSIAIAQGKGTVINLLKAYELANEAEVHGIERASKIKEFIESKMTEEELLKVRN
jgi:uncharacterized protein